MKIDLPIITGKVPYEVEQAIERLREAIESYSGLVATLQKQVAAGPSLAQIRDALSATGAYPLDTAGLLFTNPPPTTPVPPSNPVPGQQLLTGYADVCADGTKVRSTGPLSGNPASVQFDGDTPIALPEFGLFLAAASGGFGHLAIVKGETTGHALLVDRIGTVTDLGQAWGNYPVGIRDDGVEVFQDSSSTYLVGGVSNPIPPAYVGTTKGFLEFDGAGDPVWLEAQVSSPIIIDGVAFRNASRNGNWTVGESTEADQYIGYDHGSGEMFTVTFRNGSTIAPRVTQQADGSAICAVSQPTGFFPDSNWYAYGIPVNPPDPADHLADVVLAKADLVAAGIDLTGPCGAFQIVKLVAWRLHASDSNVGILDKPGGNNCEGYAVDIVAYTDGTLIDVVGSAGENNVPRWAVVDHVDPSRWRAPIPPAIP